MRSCDFCNEESAAFIAERVPLGWAVRHACVAHWLQSVHFPLADDSSSDGTLVRLPDSWPDERCIKRFRSTHKKD